MKLHAIEPWQAELLHGSEDFSPDRSGWEQRPDMPPVVLALQEHTESLAEVALGLERPPASGPIRARPRVAPRCPPPGTR